MAVLNIHERRIPGPPDQVGALIDGLSGEDDQLWPGRDWPRLRLDAGLAVGSSGGHGPIGYTVSGYAPGNWIRFEFTAPRGFNGFHEFSVHPADDGGAVLRHTLAMTTRGAARLTWPLAFRRLHDALLEDSLDRAERVCGSEPRTPANWSRYVRLLRLLRRTYPDTTSSIQAARCSSNPSPVPSSGPRAAEASPLNAREVSRPRAR
ncbi:SRPBCC family protein [Kitasatospora sp. NPDC051170]|uniref:SRPBCC family protein n=1 Tax=Kitasatospora sp. NPDC051170 TaxID=3364056 RepID=UPI0037BA250E